MIETVREWLPPCVATCDTINSKLSAAVANWGRRWFARDVVRMASLAPGDVGVSMAGESRVGGRFASVSLPNTMKARLQQLALDLDFVGLAPTAVDRRILKGFVDGVLRDLIDVVERHLDLPGGLLEQGTTVATAGGASLLAAVFIGRDRLMTLSVSPAAAIAIHKTCLPPARRPDLELVSREKALASTPVTLEAMIGGVSMSLSDLREMTAGDVVILDAPLRQGVSVGIANSDAVIARGQLGHADGRLSITL
jgi:flagellar motor switch/type III secretory pathway protein FliN